MRHRDDFWPLVLTILLMTGVLYGCLLSPVIASPWVEVRTSPAVLRAQAATALVRTPWGCGTAWCVRAGSRGSSALWITCYHVVEEAPPRQIALSQGTGGPLVAATLVAVRSSDDLALLRAAVDAPAIPLAVEPPEAGDEVFAVGAPAGLPGLAFWGHVSATDPRAIADGTWLMLDFPAYPGLSGSAVCNTDGAAVGVVKAYIPGSHVTLAVSMQALARFVRGRI